MAAAQAGSKRARSDGLRGDGDWTCPQCGNVNFAFRSTCNMRKCGASKPMEPVHRGMGIPMGPYDHQPPPAIYMGGPPLPLMAPAYGAPMPMPPQGAPVAFDYGASAGNYNHPIPLAASYGVPGGMMGAPGYGAPVMDGFGMGIGIGRGPPMGAPRPGFFVEENGSRKRGRGGAEATSEGDWACPKCGNKNFAFRTVCNMRKCGTPKPTEQAMKHGNGPAKSASQGPPPEGSWTCEACGNVNYPFRTKCNRRNCGAEKPTDSNKAAKSPESDQ